MLQLRFPERARLVQVRRCLCRVVCGEHDLEQIIDAIEDCAGRGHADDSRQQAHIHGGHALLLQQVAEGADDPPIHVTPRPHHPSAHHIQGETGHSGRDTCKHADLQLYCMGTFGSTA